jgi:hypothetical protein
MICSKSQEFVARVAIADRFSELSKDLRLPAMKVRTSHADNVFS